jgi:guanosine-3',5'-bis(diphosphate) 3'-pyrophosphohydrolase
MKKSFAKARKPQAKKTAHKKVTKTAKTAKKASGFSKHVHPYGTTRHGAMDWQLARLEARLATMEAQAAATTRSALAFAQERHNTQTRDGGQPYVIHPIRIANILLYEWATENPELIAAAMLHDVVEDTQTTIKEIKDRFGNDIGKLVDGMTMWKGSETYETYIKRVSRGPEPLRVLKCADTLDNLRSWYDAAGMEFPRWWRQANDLVLPMARSVDDEGVVATSIDRVLRDPWYLKRAGME